MARFPPGKGGGEGVARGGKGKGILSHSLTEGGGIPLATRTTPANGDERAHVLPLRDAVKVHTGKRGCPCTRRRREGYFGACSLYPLENFGVVLDQLGKNLY